MNYYDFQSNITTGDWIEVQGKSKLGEKIRDFTGKDVNHSALVIRFLEYEIGMTRRFVIEALDDGLELNFLSDLVADNTFAYWYQLKPEYHHLRASIGIWMLHEYSKHRGKKPKYDLWNLIRQAWRRVKLDPSAWFCSEWCQAAYCHAGLLPSEYCGKEGIGLQPGEIEQFNLHQPKVKLTINKEV